jgi:bifunctional N-acetylglucosamine-1-phosphate-uridyltransferase/glucosamine-1-phosphate-acetyltransferase GlmU-like protein
VIGENCRIGSFSNLKNSVVGDNEKIAEKSSIDEELIWTQPIPKGYPDKQIGNVIRK